MTLRGWGYVAVRAIRLHQGHRIEPERLFLTWDAPPYCEIQKKIGEELRKLLEPPKEIPHQLLTVLMQLNDQSEG